MLPTLFFNSRMSFWAPFLPIPGMLVKKGISAVWMAWLIWWDGWVRIWRAILGPMPDTEMRSWKVFLFWSVVNPYSVIWSSRTWV